MLKLTKIWKCDFHDKNSVLKTWIVKDKMHCLLAIVYKSPLSQYQYWQNKDWLALFTNMYVKQFKHSAFVFSPAKWVKRPQSYAIFIYLDAFYFLFTTSVTFSQKKIETKAKKGQLQNYKIPQVLRAFLIRDWSLAKNQLAISVKSSLTPSPILAEHSP